MKRWIATLLLAAILVSALPMSAAAAQWRDPQRTTSAEAEGDFASMIPSDASGTLTAEIQKVRSGSYEPLVTSQALIDIIKEKEGFAEKPYWDYGHWAIGYGSTCPDDMLEEYMARGITEAEAEALLREYVAIFEGSVNGYGRRKGIQFSQCQFDALVDFTYALGDAWTTMTCQLSTWLQNPTSDIDFVNAIGRWCRVAGDIWGGTCARRIMEAKIFLYGDYNYKEIGERDFSYVIFHGVKVNMTSSYEDDVAYYTDGQPYGQLPTPTLKGYRFLGWFTAEDGGEQLKATDIVRKYKTVYAHWEEGDEPEPTEPEPTEPEPTEPEPTDPDALPFTDVSESSWYYDAVSYMYRAHLIKGMTDTTFGPKTKLTRAMLVTLFYRLDGQPEVSAKSTFKDVNQKAYYANAVAWAQENKVVQGDANNCFRPNELITRQDTVVIMHRFCVYVMKLDCPPIGSLDGFSDEKQVSGYAKEAMAWAVGADLLHGYKNGTLLPKGTISRAETAVLFYNLYQRIG